MADLHRLRFVTVADVYRAGRLAGRLERTGDAGTAFTYDQAYLDAGHPPVAVTLPLATRHGGFVVAPVYDVPCTLLYGDDSQALPVDGRMKNLRSRHWAAFAQAIGLPERATLAANALALRAASAVDLKALPFEGSPLTRTERELRYCRGQLET